MRRIHILYFHSRPYRAPELFVCEVGAEIGPAVDIWVILLGETLPKTGFHLSVAGLRPLFTLLLRITLRRGPRTRGQWYGSLEMPNHPKSAFDFHFTFSGLGCPICQIEFQQIGPVCLQQQNCHSVKIQSLIALTKSWPP